MLSPEEEKQRGGLSRERLVAAALELIHEEGIEALSMRGLADRLEVKAASLYWHVRDRRELLELLEALERSDTFADLKAQFQRAGLQAAEAADLARLTMIYVINGPSPTERPAVESRPVGAPALSAIDSGSRGVALRAGPTDMRELIQMPHDRSGASPA